MKLIGLKCPNCSGNIRIDNEESSYCLCPYCGTQFYIDDEVQKIEVVYRDEAKIRELEYEQLEKIRLHNVFVQQSKQRKKRRNLTFIRFWLYVTLFYVALSLIALLGKFLHNAALMVPIIIVGIPGLFIATNYHPYGKEDPLEYKYPIIKVFLKICLIYFTLLIMVMVF